jgi:taurine dioxygenase
MVAPVWFCRSVVQFPERKGWHSDQSFRRPPPDGSLLYCARPALPNQGRTLFCDASAAYEGLQQSEAAQVEQMEIIHCITSAGRSEASVRSGNIQNSRSDEGARYLQPVRQPAVRVHPVTGRRSLYLVMGQADWLDGPVAGMEPGPDGAGADALRKLMSHATQPRFVYSHEWSAGDCVLYDNRCLLHAATWFDESAARREMWRLTVTGNPGPQFEQEVPSWQQLSSSSTSQGAAGQPSSVATTSRL